MKNVLYALVALLLLGAVIYLGGCSYRNVETIKANASITWEKAGFRVVGYQGYQLGRAFETPGGEVWYIVEKIGDSRVRYQGFISKWGDEFHIYGLHAIDAIAAR